MKSTPVINWPKPPTPTVPVVPFDPQAVPRLVDLAWEILNALEGVQEPSWKRRAARLHSALIAIREQALTNPASRGKV